MYKVLDFVSVYCGQDCVRAIVLWVGALFRRQGLVDRSISGPDWHKPQLKVVATEFSQQNPVIPVEFDFGSG